MTKVMKLSVTPSVLEEWRTSEIASWEDAKMPEEGHAFTILSRHKTLIEIQSLQEVALLIKSANFQGDTCGICDDLVKSHQAIQRIGDRLIEAYRIAARKLAEDK